MTTRTEDKDTERPQWLPEEVWPFDLRSIEVDGVSIAYTDEGQGPTLLLVHDGMWSYVWGQLISELKSRFRVVTLDFPGSGLSPESDRKGALEADSFLLESFVARLKLKRLTLVLHDLGGAVGAGMAARRPQLVEGMVLINTFAWPPQVIPLRLMLAVVSSAPVSALNTATNLIPRLTSGSSGIGRHLDPAARRAFLGGFKRRGARRRFHDLIAAARSETDYLQRVETALISTLSDLPALTIYGEKNDPFGFQVKFRDQLKDVEAMIIPEGNHFPMADDPVGVAERITAWHGSKIRG